jgi:hypothetical protein
MERAGQTTIDEVLKGWKDSPGHNGNLLLADVEPMGIAQVHDPKTVFTAFRALVIAASGWGSGGETGRHQAPRPNR